MNILVFTAIYPIAGTAGGFTPVVNYFCEEWVKKGHHVTVVIASSKFPYLYYHLPKRLKELLESRIGFNLPNRQSRETLSLSEKGVNILQLPISKFLPGQIPNDSIINNSFQEVLKYLNINKFIPDLAIGHWLSPQTQLLSLTKAYFNCKTALTLHSTLSFKEMGVLNENLNSIDNIGYRSIRIKEAVNDKIDLSNKRHYLCYSGVKDYFGIANSNFQSKKRRNNSIKICFVGNLIQRKFPEKIIEAINLIDIPNLSFDVHYVGSGSMIKKIESITLKSNINITFHGRINRKEVYEVLEGSDLFIMISKNEAFGLVYLEAMLNRTIPIASYNEGFDGIIKNEVNGFLSKAGDVNELKKIIETIVSLSEQEYLEIQKNAFETAKKMTDEKMALDYLNNIYKNKK